MAEVSRSCQEFAVRLVDPHGGEAAELIRHLSQELAERYDFSDDGSGLFQPSDATVPGSAFVIGYLDQHPVACGAFRPLEGDVCEIKRMFVRPAFRSRGFATRLLCDLERLASEAGYARARLETGDRQPEAIKLYERAGYLRIANFGVYVDNAHSVCFEKPLPPERDRSNSSTRAATPEDFSAVFPLLKQLWPGADLAEGKMSESFAANARMPNHYQFCHLLGTRVIGFATLFVRNSLWQQANLAYVGELVIDEAHRGHGHGKAMLTFLGDFAGQLGCARLELDSASGRIGTHAFYEHCGLARRGFVFSRPLDPNLEHSEAATRNRAGTK